MENNTELDVAFKLYETLLPKEQQLSHLSLEEEQRYKLELFLSTLDTIKARSIENIPTLKKEEKKPRHHSDYEAPRQGLM